MDVRPSAEMDADLFIALGLVYVEKVSSEGATCVEGAVGSAPDETDAQVRRHNAFFPTHGV